MRQTGGRGQYGHAVIDLEPAPGEGFDFVNKIRGGSIPSEFIPAVEQGIEEALESGVKAGYPMVDVRVTLTDGSYHDVDSSEMAFKVAGSMAFREAARRAKPVLLEPIMAVEVVTPEEFMGDVIGDLNRRRGRIEGMEPRGNAQVIKAHVPLAEMFGYATDLRSRRRAGPPTRCSSTATARCPRPLVRGDHRAPRRHPRGRERLAQPGLPRRARNGPAGRGPPGIPAIFSRLPRVAPCTPAPGVADSR